MRLPARQRVLRLTAFSSENRRKYAVFCAKRDEQLGWWCTQQQQRCVVYMYIISRPSNRISSTSLDERRTNKSGQEPRRRGAKTVEVEDQ